MVALGATPSSLMFVSKRDNPLPLLLFAPPPFALPFPKLKPSRIFFSLALRSLRFFLGSLILGTSFLAFLALLLSRVPVTSSSLETWTPCPIVQPINQLYTNFSGFTTIGAIWRVRCSCADRHKCSLARRVSLLVVDTLLSSISRD